MSNKQDLIEEICDQINKLEVDWLLCSFFVGDTLKNGIIANINDLEIVITPSSQPIGDRFEVEIKANDICEVEFKASSIQYTRMHDEALRNSHKNRDQAEAKKLEDVLSILKGQKPTV